MRVEILRLIVLFFIIKTIFIVREFFKIFIFKSSKSIIVILIAVARVDFLKKKFDVEFF